MFFSRDLCKKVMEMKKEVSGRDQTTDFFGLGIVVEVGRVSKLGDSYNFAKRIVF